MNTELEHNILTKSDSYKVLHGLMLPEGTEYVYSYFESRNGAKFDTTPFFGLQAILKKYFEGVQVTEEKIHNTRLLCAAHFNGLRLEDFEKYVTNGVPLFIEKKVRQIKPEFHRAGSGEDHEFEYKTVHLYNKKAIIDFDRFYRETGKKEYFNLAGWTYILKKKGGKLPLRIKAVPEGTPVNVSNILMSVENTDKKCAFLTNYVESILTHVWYPSTVAALARDIKVMFKEFLDRTSDNPGAINFMLHDFGYRGVSSDESSMFGGSGQLLSFLGTDTMVAMEFLAHYYYHNLNGIAYSVAATEHSIMTARGRYGEDDVLDQLLLAYQNGILSVVIDSYDTYEFVEEKVCKKFRDAILKRDGVFVLRPDSITPRHPTPEKLTLWIVQTLAHYFGYTTNSKGFMVLNPKVRVLWGDGIDQDGIRKILEVLEQNGFAACNMVFGMGGGLLQKVNRDTQRFAFKASAQCRNGQWHDVFKMPKDLSKMSKKGKLKLIKDEKGEFQTVPYGDGKGDHLVTVFEDGEILTEYTLDEIRENIKL